MAVILFLFCNYLQAQQDTVSADTVHRYLSDEGNFNTEYFTENNWLNFTSTDTTIFNIHKFNPARNQNVPYAYLTNLGAPYYNRFFTYNRTLGFDLGRDNIALYQNNMQSLHYYRTNAPFTEIFYLLGTKGEQWIRFMHTQNFGPRFNLALNFDKPIAAGYYLQERKSYSNFDLTTWWRSKDSRYKVYFGFIFNETDNEENGGISVDTLFTGYEGPRNLAETFRTDALTEWRSFQGQITQTYDVGITETIAVDDTTFIKQFTPKAQILYRVGAADFDYSFKDATGDNTYYPAIFADADTLTDISDVDGFYNFISFGDYAVSLNDSMGRDLLKEIFIQQQTYNLTDASGSYTKNYLILGGKIDYHVNDLFQTHINAAYDIAQNDFEVALRLHGNFSYLPATLQLHLQKVNPQWLTQHYYGFAYRWENTFTDIVHNSVSIKAELPNLFTTVVASLNLYDNFIFYNTDGTPEQITDNFQSIQLEVEQHFAFGDFYLDNYFQVQILSRYEKHFPVYQSNHSFYLMRNLFKSALRIQTGVDLWYATAYDGYEYNIVTGQFLLQSDTHLQFTPVMDLFVNFDIKALRFFIKFDNFSMNFFDRGYYEAPRYPMQDRTFKLGISWQLYY